MKKTNKTNGMTAETLIILIFSILVIALIVNHFGDNFIIGGIINKFDYCTVNIQDCECVETCSDYVESVDRKEFVYSKEYQDEVNDVIYIKCLNKRDFFDYDKCLKYQKKNPCQLILDKDIRAYSKEEFEEKFTKCICEEEYDEFDGNWDCSSVGGYLVSGSKECANFYGLKTGYIENSLEGYILFEGDKEINLGNESEFLSIEAERMKCTKAKQKTEEDIYCEKNPNDFSRCECIKKREPWIYRDEPKLYGEIRLHYPATNYTYDGIFRKSDIQYLDCPSNETSQGCIIKNKIEECNSPLNIWFDGIHHIDVENPNMCWKDGYYVKNLTIIYQKCLEAIPK